jgi:hypothetical protein
MVDFGCDVAGKLGVISASECKCMAHNQGEPCVCLSDLCVHKTTVSVV